MNGKRNQIYLFHVHAVLLSSLFHKLITRFDEYHYLLKQHKWHNSHYLLPIHLSQYNIMNINLLSLAFKSASLLSCFSPQEMISDGLHNLDTSRSHTPSRHCINIDYSIHCARSIATTEVALCISGHLPLNEKLDFFSHLSQTLPDYD